MIAPRVLAFVSKLDARMGRRLCAHWNSLRSATMFAGACELSHKIALGFPYKQLTMSRFHLPHNFGTQKMR